MRVIVLFPDTNIFLQCKALGELPWKESFEADHIELLIGAPVQDEIDRLKQDGNQRRARRAREANSLFRTLLESATETLVVRENDPRIVLKFAPQLPPRRATSQSLDLTRADDRLIDEVQHYLSSAGTAQILSGDTGMRLRARRHQVSVFPITDAWLLPPESDERDREIQALKTKLARFENAEPVLEVIPRDIQGNAIESISASLPSFLPLSQEEVDRFVSKIQSAHPKAEDFGLEPPSRSSDDHVLQEIFTASSWQAPTPDEIKTYGSDYDEWIQKARSRLERLNFVLNASERILHMRIDLRNTGSRPADEVLFELNARGGLKFCISENGDTPKVIDQLGKLDRTITLPPPPTPPKGGYMARTLGRLADNAFGGGIIRPEKLFPQLHAMATPTFNRERHVFYRQGDESEPTTRCSFSRSEVRHRADPQTFDIWLIVPFERQVVKSHLHCRVSASNLSRPLHLRIPIALRSEQRSTLDSARLWSVKKEKRKERFS